MKEYWSIPGWQQASLGLPCIAFDKPDGSNFRAEWSKKRGFYKYGTRTQLIDNTHPNFGKAVDLFNSGLAGELDKVLRNNKKLPSFDSCVVFMEYWGPNSCFGQHIDESKTLTPFDINLNKRGFVSPRDFIKTFGDLPIPKVLYEGNFNKSFIEDVRNGVYGTGEGVVAKGILPGKKEPHGIWMSKVKTNAWMDRLKIFAANNTNLAKMYQDNLKEQNI